MGDNYQYVRSTYTTLIDVFHLTSDGKTVVTVNFRHQSDRTNIWQAEIESRKKRRDVRKYSIAHQGLVLLDRDFILAGSDGRSGCQSRNLRIGPCGPAVTTGVIAGFSGLVGLRGHE